jgi:hypothetical protein
VSLAGNPRNALILTQRAPSWTLASRVLEASRSPSSNKVLKIKRLRTVPLAGEELIVYQEEQQLKLDQSELEQRAELSEDSDDDDEAGGGEESLKKMQFVPRCAASYTTRACLFEMPHAHVCSKRHISIRTLIASLAPPADSLCMASRRRSGNGTCMER